MLDNSRDSTDSHSQYVWLPNLKVWGFLRHSSSSHPYGDSSSTKDTASSSSPLRSSTDQNTSPSLQNLNEEALSQNKFRVCSEKSTDSSPPEQMQSSEKSSSRELDQEVVCPICLGAVEDGRRVVIWGCMHGFCIDCIEAWSRLRRSCPLCKAEYCGWNQVGRRSGEMQKRCLSPLEFRPSFCLEDYRPSIAESEFPERTSTTSRSSGRLISARESVRNTLTFRSRLRLQQLAHARSASRSYRRYLPLPRQRFFGPSVWPTSSERERVAADAAAERVLRWRSSIYRRCLKAVPFQIRKADTSQSILSDPDAKLRAERRLGPWISRELQAVLGNSDPAVAHRVLGLWFSYRTNFAEKLQDIVDREDENTLITETRRKAKFRLDSELSGAAIEELTSFLDDKGPLFWHELRCFAESPFTLNTYDSLVVYSRQEQ